MECQTCIKYINDNTKNVFNKYIVYLRAPYVKWHPNMYMNEINREMTISNISYGKLDFQQY